MREGESGRSQQGSGPLGQTRTPNALVWKLQKYVKNGCHCGATLRPHSAQNFATVASRLVSDLFRTRVPQNIQAFSGAEVKFCKQMQDSSMAVSPEAATPPGPNWGPWGAHRAPIGPMHTKGPMDFHRAPTVIHDGWVGGPYKLPISRLGRLLC